MESVQIISTILGLLHLLLPLLGVLGVLRKAYKKLTKKRTSLKSEENFFKNTFLVDFLDEKRKGIRNMIIYILVSFGVFLVLLAFIISSPKDFIIDATKWCIIPIMSLAYFITLGFLFDMRKMPVYESALESENITIFLKRALEKKDIDEKEMIDRLRGFYVMIEKFIRIYKLLEKPKDREEIKKMEENIFKELK